MLNAILEKLFSSLGVQINAYSFLLQSGGPIMNLISGTHYLCERRKYAFILLWFYTWLLLDLSILLRFWIPCSTTSHHSNLEYDLLHFKIRQFVYFMVQILFPRSNNINIVTSFKILNDVTVYTLLDLCYLI